MFKNFLLLLFGVVCIQTVFGQKSSMSSNFNAPKTYEVKEVGIEGVKYLQTNPIIRFTGLYAGKKITIPGDDISDAIDKLWGQGLFSEVNIYASKIDGDKISLVIHLQERPRMGKITFIGVRKGEAKDLKELIKFKSGVQLTENIKNKAKDKIVNLYESKGFYGVDVQFVEKPDTSQVNVSDIDIVIEKNGRYKIKEINISGNKDVSSAKLRRKLKNTKQKTWYNIFKRSKYVEDDFQEDLKTLLAFYKADGYRDAEVLRDTVYEIDEKLLQVDIDLIEGTKYYFRDISWVGNTKHTSEYLSALLGIKKGDVYSEEKLSERIFGLDGVSSLYLDDGYLFFNADPVEKNIVGDSIDLEIRIFEGRQARIKNVIIKGNDKTHDHVIRRELRTKPGQLFSRADIIRTQRELSQLGYFNPETIGINPIPNQEDGTVDIEYTLEERSSDQIELSGGLSGSYFIGSLSLALNNFSARKMIQGKGFTPIPSGDGQHVTLRATANPRYYQAFSASFTEPWLGGKKPNSLTVSFSTSRYGNSNYLYQNSAAVGLGRRLKWPDDFFTLYNELSFKNYRTVDYDALGLGEDNGTYNSLALATVFGRNSVDQPLYPQRGSDFSIRAELAVPMSLLLDKSSDQATIDKWIEYHKWIFKFNNYTSVVKKLVLATKTEFGFLGYYDSEKKSPMENFRMGGSFMQSMNLGYDFVSLRGYDENALTPTSYTPAVVYSKYSLEMRYPLTLSASATIYGLVFAEAGNAWSEFNEYDPFDVKKSAGFGIRMFMPMFGLLGFDLGYGFDNPLNSYGEKSAWQPHFVLGQQF